MSKPETFGPFGVSEDVVIEHSLDAFSRRLRVTFSCVCLEHGAAYKKLDIIAPTESGLIGPIVVIPPANDRLIYILLN